MAKTFVDQWDTTAGNNTGVGGINIEEGMAIGDVSKALREMMAQFRTFSTSAVPAGVTASYVGSTAPFGWRFPNGDTLGSTASTATQKSDDYQTLYELIWITMAYTEAWVEGGRGGPGDGRLHGQQEADHAGCQGPLYRRQGGTATLLTAAISMDGVTLGKTGSDQLAQDHILSGSSTNVTNDDAGELGTNFNKGAGPIGLASTVGDASAPKMEATVAVFRRRSS